MHIRDWPEAERPREKLLAHGAGALSDAELLAIFLGSGLPGRDAVQTAVWLHGRAGDVCAARMGEYAMNPTDVIAALPEVTKTIIR